MFIDPFIVFAAALTTAEPTQKPCELAPLTSMTAPRECKPIPPKDPKRNENGSSQ